MTAAATRSPAGRSARRKTWVPEVVQTSAMDCGPASLKCLLEGFGIRVSYGRLREACQTDVDGTSIDTLEEVANRLGLDAEQVLVPVDHLLVPEGRAYPAIVVVRLPNGANHFVVVWRRHGRFVQVMDPATGRRFVTSERFREEVYVHTIEAEASSWRKWVESGAFLGPLDSRLRGIGASPAESRRRIERALADPSWRSMGVLDAAVRMVESMTAGGGLARGRESVRVLDAFVERALTTSSSLFRAIPDVFWSAFPAPPGPAGEERLHVRGAVLVRAKGRRPDPDTTTAGPLSAELEAALREPPPRPGRDLFRYLRADGLLAPSVVLAALVLGAAGVVFEALLFRALLEVGRELTLVEERIGALAGLLLFVIGFLLLEVPLTRAVLRIGRHLEIRLRMAFLAKIPRLGDRYFRSRLTSDMAERSHSIHSIRALPGLGAQLLRSCFVLVFTTAGIVWIDPAAAPAALLAAFLSIAVPLAIQPFLAERDLRVRTHTGALTRFYLDALLGLVPVRAHGAERAIRREHESLLSEWTRSRLSLQKGVVVAEGIAGLCGFGLAAWILTGHLERSGETGGVLLLIYWALAIPAVGQEVALLVRQYPALRNLTLRLTEPLGALEEAQPASREAAPIPARPSRPGVGIEFRDVTVRAAGHTILRGIDLGIKAGTHAAIVGPSGAGKSTLVGVLLGWHRPAEGEVRIDDERLDATSTARLRRETAWVDPAVQLWNRSLLDNLRYGSSDAENGRPLGSVLEEADLREVLETLPDGLQTPLGEGGALVSGGEGQRVRLGRAMLRSETRLVLLDEPFRGLQREQRQELLARARRIWKDATLVCVTHDVGETRLFDHVTILEEGRIAESGDPSELAGRPGSRYAGLLAAEREVDRSLWGCGWKRLRLADGRLVEEKGSSRPEEETP
jgi:ATP-binding cassette subfamily B protein